MLMALVLWCFGLLPEKGLIDVDGYMAPVKLVLCLPLGMACFSFSVFMLQKGGWLVVWGLGWLIIWEHFNLKIWHVMRSCESGSKVGSGHLVLLLVISCSFEYSTNFFFSLISINQTLLCESLTMVPMKRYISFVLYRYTMSVPCCCDWKENLRVLKFPLLRIVQSFYFCIVYTLFLQCCDIRDCFVIESIVQSWNILNDIYTRWLMIKKVYGR